jgi:hypothetical protein
MDEYTKSGVVGRGATKATAELGEKLFGMVVEELVPMVKKALKEEKPKSSSRNRSSNNNNNKRRRSRRRKLIK